jgi:hypothetical protein
VSAVLALAAGVEVAAERRAIGAVALRLRQSLVVVLAAAIAVAAALRAVT